MYVPVNQSRDQEPEALPSSGALSPLPMRQVPAPALGIGFLLASILCASNSPVRQRGGRRAVPSAWNGLLCVYCTHLVGHS